MTGPTDPHAQIDRDTAEFEAMGGKVTYYRTKSTGEIIECMKNDAEAGLWNSSELADLEARKQMKGKK